MIRGIVSVVPSKSLVAGAFYLCPRYNDEPYLIQAVSETAEQVPTHALVFEPDVNPPLSLMTLEGPTPYILMPEVSIRVDPPSVSGHTFSSGLRSGMLIISDQIPYAVASLQYRGYSVINMVTGLVSLSEASRGEVWAAFSRWQLIVDENGEEVPIASFGERPSESQ